MEEFVSQVREPLMVIDIDKSMKGFVLQKYLNKFHRAIRQRCHSFVGKQTVRPKLPSQDTMASIGLRTKEMGLVLVCFRLRDLYCMGVYKINSKLFYECKRTDCPTGVVENSIALGRGDGYGDLLALRPESPSIELCAQCFEYAYQSFMKLGTVRENKGAALYGIGLICWLIFEPSRSAFVQAWLVGEPGRNHRDNSYAVIGTDS